MSANRKAARMLGTTDTGLMGGGFAAGLYDEDARILSEALADPDRDRPPVVLRWGATPPVDFIALDLRRDTDGTLLAVLQDQTDQHRLDAVMAGQGTLAQVFDREGRVRWISPGSAERTAIDPQRHVGTQGSTLVHPDDLPILLRVAGELRANPGSEIVAWYRARSPSRPDADWSWFRSTLISMPDDPIIGGVVIVSQPLAGAPPERAATTGPADMTVAEMMPSGLIFMARGRLQFRNGLARRMIGPAVEATDAYAWVAVLRPDHRRRVRESLAAAADDGRRSTVTAALDRVGEKTLWMRLEAMPSYDAVGTHVGYAVTLLDITAERSAREAMQRTQEQLWQLANHDVLTGLPNRMHCLDRLVHALARTRREGRSTAVLYCDLDHFKQVNDNFGHAGGDTLLVEIARRLNAAVRETDTVSRLGGDEFVVICEAFEDFSDIEALAGRIIAVVNQPVVLGSTSATVGLSVGIAVAGPGSTADELLDRADAAGYLAKSGGRNRFVTASSGSPTADSRSGGAG
jgi:diguanylate cyclase (GGDEF)-like protein